MARATLIAKVFEIGQDADGLLDAHLDNTEVFFSQKLLNSFVALKLDVGCKSVIVDNIIVVLLASGGLGFGLDLTLDRLLGVVAEVFAGLGHLVIEVHLSFLFNHAKFAFLTSVVVEFTGNTLIFACAVVTAH